MPCKKPGKSRLLMTERAVGSLVDPVFSLQNQVLKLVPTADLANSSIRHPRAALLRQAEFLTTR